MSSRFSLFVLSLALGVGAALVAPAPAADPAGQSANGVDEPVLFEETFINNNRHWQVDAYSRFEHNAYIIDARGQGGYPRWINDPGNLRDVRLRAELVPQAGNPSAHFGLLFRVQDSWANSYYFIVNSQGNYLFGKFVSGKDVPIKEGVAKNHPTPGHPVTLEVAAAGNAFGLMVGDEFLATVVDNTYPGGGRVGLFAEAPVRVQFNSLRATQPNVAGGELPPTTRFVDHFDGPNGWPEDEHRQLTGGAYHLLNNGEARTFVSWNRETENLTDYVVRVDTRQYRGMSSALFGLIFRAKDADNYGFFVIGADGRFFAGALHDGGTPVVKSHGRSVSVRGPGEVNSLSVRAEGAQFICGVNGNEITKFTDPNLPTGAVGFYLQEPADVAFDDLVVTDLPQPAPPQPGKPGEAQPLAVGPVLFLDRLLAAGGDAPWPVDAFHGYEQGGYVVRAPAKGSRTALRPLPQTYRDGVFTVTVRPIVGSVGAGYGLAFRANADGNSFYFLLISACGNYFAGRCLQGQYQILDSGPVPFLRGGTLGNELQVTLKGSTISYAVNDRALGSFRDDSLAEGLLGLHVENGVSACFRDLRAFNLPAQTQ